MNKIEKIIKSVCPNGVEYKDLEKCCNILDNKRKPVTKSAREFGKYPYYGANGIQDYVSNYIFDGRYVLVGEDGSVINENGNPIVTWAEGKIWVNNHAHIIEEIDGVLLRYLYHYIQTINVTNLIHGNIPKLNQGDFRKLKIAVPPLEVQDEIVHILDDFTLLSAELSAELKAREKQYEYYKDKIFNISNEPIFVEIKDVLQEKGYIRGPFGSALRKSDMVENGVPIYEQQHAIYNHRNFRYFISNEKAKSLSRFIVKDGDIILSCSGTVGRTSIIKPTDEKGVINQALLILRVNSKKINVRFLEHFLNSSYGRKKILSNTNGSAQVNICKREDFEKIKIPLPNIDEQNKIVNILDRFDKLCNDILEGLPAEIEARRKQYEYYRNKLLTFKELVNEG